MTSPLESRANELVSPNSGIANDYLNHFNEIYLLIENLPALLPEMIDELLDWRPISYREHFLESSLPGREHALEIYESLDPAFRKDFEGMIGLLDAIVLKSIAIISAARNTDGSLDPDGIDVVCEELAADMRIVLERTADLVNHGYAPPLERPQEMADRLLAIAGGRP